MGVRKQVVVLAHDDESVVALLRALLEPQGWVVEIPATIDDAEARLVRGHVDAVLTAWDRPLGRDLYRRVVDAHDLRHRFVFLVEGEIPEKLAEAAARRRVVRLADLGAIVEAVARRIHRSPAHPRLLLVDDDPEQLAGMSSLLVEEGFDVTTAGSGRAAIAILETASFDHVLSDWSMADGDGAELHQWIAAERPDLLDHLVFLTGGDPNEPSRRVAPVPVVPKGQDSPTLLAVLRRTAAAPRLAQGTPARGITPIAEPAVEPLPARLPPIPAPARPRSVATSYDVDEPTQVDSANGGS